MINYESPQDKSNLENKLEKKIDSIIFISNKLLSALFLIISCIIVLMIGIKTIINIF